MKQIRIKSGKPQSYLTVDKWYDVIREDGLTWIINDIGTEAGCRLRECGHLDGGDWEVREVKEESMKEHKISDEKSMKEHKISDEKLMKEHKISDEKLREIYNHPDICDEWKERIKEAVPTFKVDKWVDITKKMNMVGCDHDVNMVGRFPNGEDTPDFCIPFFLTDGMKWGRGNMSFKVEKGRLYRRVE